MSYINSVVVDMRGYKYRDWAEVFANAFYVREYNVNEHGDDIPPAWAVCDILTGGAIAAFSAQHIAIQFAEKLEREFGDLRWLMDLPESEFSDHPIADYMRCIRQHESYCGD